jgi:hypothetical protein
MSENKYPEAKAARDPDVQSAVQELNSTIDRLDKEIADLIERLTQITREVPKEENVPTETGAKSHCQLAERVRTATLRLAHFIDKLNTQKIHLEI